MKGYQMWIFLAFFGSAYTFSTVRGLYWLDGNVSKALGISVITAWLVFSCCLGVALFVWADNKYRVI